MSASSEDAPSLKADTRAERRQKFFEERRREILTWGVEVIDEALVVYRATDFSHEGNPEAESAPTQSDTEQRFTVRDRMVLDAQNCDGVQFLKLLEEQWWPARQKLRELGQVRIAEHGLYSRYLDESGFLLVAEFNEEGFEQLWRVDARPKATSIKRPTNEGEFFDLFGTFFDLRAGWRWLLDEQLASGEIILREVQAGYLIGARAGVPGSDPATREDPALEAAFSRFDLERFDTLEFLHQHPDPTTLPVPFAPFSSWLSEGQGAQISSGKVELFVLANSEGFFDAVEELATRRGLKAVLHEDESGPMLSCAAGPLTYQAPFGQSYLSTIWGGQSFSRGALERLRDALEALSEAEKLRQTISARFPSLRLEIKDGELLLGGEDQVRARVPLVAWASLGAFEGTQGAEQLLRLFGFQEESGRWSDPNHPLDRCPICGRPAQLRPALRPSPLGDERPLQLGEHMIELSENSLRTHYLLDCGAHQVPVFWQTLEELRAHFDQTGVAPVIEAELPLTGHSARLLLGTEIAAACLHPSVAAQLCLGEENAAWLLSPDLIALSNIPLDAAAIDEARSIAEELLMSYRPSRRWPLDAALTLKSR
ncbi:MAG: hypothetical protein VYD19_07565 [Myxococcota bacterium]|nr:hypothetical protein [Myxococcota bacterium]